MIYVLVEDANDGYILCNKIVKYYFSEDNIVVTSCKGILNLKIVLEDLFKQISSNDSVVIVYDDIIENPIVSRSLEESEEYIAKENVYMLPTKSFELETILIDDIEFTANYNNYKEYVRKIKEAYDIGRGINYLTKITKEDVLYDDMYAHIREEKKKKRLYQQLTSKQFEKAITIESLSKKLLSKIYGESIVKKPMGDCWVNTCCYKTRNRKCSPYLNQDMMLKIDYALLKVMISNTDYKKLIILLNRLLGKNVQIDTLKIESLIDEEVKHSCYINKCIREEKYDMYI